MIPFFTTAEFNSGSVPGCPMHTGHTLVFGSKPYSYAHRQNAFVFEFNCTCVSIPITASNRVSSVTTMFAFPGSFAIVTPSARVAFARARVPARPRPSRPPRVRLVLARRAPLPSRDVTVEDVVATDARVVAVAVTVTIVLGTTARASVSRAPSVEFRG